MTLNPRLGKVKRMNDKIRENSYLKKESKYNNEIFQIKKKKKKIRIVK